MICPNCKTEFDELDEQGEPARFCPFCQLKLDSAEVRAQGAVPSPNETLPPGSGLGGYATPQAPQGVYTPSGQGANPNETLPPGSVFGGYGGTGTQLPEQLLNLEKTLPPGMLRELLRRMPSPASGQGGYGTAFPQTPTETPQPVSEGVENDTVPPFGYASSLSQGNAGSPNAEIDACVYTPSDGSCERRYGVKLEYAVNRYILAGGDVILSLRVTGQKEELTEVHAWQVINYADRPSETRAFERDWDQLDDCFSNDIPYKTDENQQGTLMIDYYVLCIMNRAVKVFTFNVQHQVISKNTDMRSIQQIINVNNIRSALHDLNLPADQQFQAVKHHLGAYNARPRDYRAVAFHDTDWRPEKAWIQGSYSKTPDMLTLTYGDLKIHLCAREEITLGRDKDNTFMVNDWRDKEHYWNENLRYSVSGHHGFFHYSWDENHVERVVIYRDTSRYGTFIRKGYSERLYHKTEDGRPAPPVRLPSNGGSICMGNFTFDFKLYKCSEAQHDRFCLTCERKLECLGRFCKAMSLHRTDGLKEVFLFVWACCDLGVAHLDLTGYTVYYRDGRFMLGTPEDELLIMSPYSSKKFSIMVNGVVLKASMFNQKTYER